MSTEAKASVGFVRASGCSVRVWESFRRTHKSLTIHWNPVILGYIYKQNPKHLNNPMTFRKIHGKSKESKKSQGFWETKDFWPLGFPWSPQDHLIFLIFWIFWILMDALSLGSSMENPKKPKHPKIVERLRISGHLVFHDLLQSMLFFWISGLLRASTTPTESLAEPPLTLKVQYYIATSRFQLKVKSQYEPVWAISSGLKLNTSHVKKLAKGGRLLSGFLFIHWCVNLILLLQNTRHRLKLNLRYLKHLPTGRS